MDPQLGGFIRAVALGTKVEVVLCITRRTQTVEEVQFVANVFDIIQNRLWRKPGFYMALLDQVPSK